MAVLDHYRCLRCGHPDCEIGHDYAMNSAGTRFVTVTCTRCRHVEFFAANPDDLPSLFRTINESPSPKTQSN